MPAPAPFPHRSVTDDRHTRQISHRSCPCWLMYGHLHTARCVAPRYPQRHLRRLAQRIRARRSRGVHRVRPRLDERGTQAARRQLSVFSRLERNGGRPSCWFSHEYSVATSTIAPQRPADWTRTGPGCFGEAAAIPGATGCGGARARISLESSWLRQIGEGRSFGSRHSEGGFLTDQERSCNRRCKAYESGPVF